MFSFWIEALTHYLHPFPKLSHIFLNYNFPDVISMETGQIYGQDLA